MAGVYDVVVDNGEESVEPESFFLVLNEPGLRRRPRSRETALGDNNGGDSGTAGLGDSGVVDQTQIGKRLAVKI